MSDILITVLIAAATSTVVSVTILGVGAWFLRKTVQEYMSPFSGDADTETFFGHNDPDPDDDEWDDWFPDNTSEQSSSDRPQE